MHWTMVPRRSAAYHLGATMLRRLRIENLVLIKEAELAFAPGLNAITGETGAGKTILAQAIGLLLGAKGDAAYIGADGTEAYVEAELDLPAGLIEEDELAALAELRPEDEEGLIVARRVFADGRTRAYAWGRAAAREDLAAAGERLIAMSGQFEQRRLARPAYQLDVLDSFAGAEQLRRRAESRLAWRELTAARRRHEELQQGAAVADARLAELRALVEDTAGLEPGEEESLRSERERLRHVTELADGAAEAAEALAPDDGEGAAGLVGSAERALAPLEQLAPELARAGDELRDVELRLRETATELRRFPHDARGRAGAARAGRGRPRPHRGHQATLSRRVLRRAARPGGGGARGARSDRGRLRSRTLPRQKRWRLPSAMSSRLAERAARRRREAAPRFAEEVARELVGVGLGEGEFVAELRERDPGQTGCDEAVFLVRPNAGLALAPVAETASGGELSRIALAIAAVAGGETMVFDEIDAGIGGETAHSGRRHAAQARRAGTGDHDHAPAADRERRRAPLPRREDPGRPDAHADQARSTTPSGATSCSACSAAESSCRASPKR